MATADSAQTFPADGLQVAYLHGVLRLSAAVTATYVIGEAMGWFPSFLAPLLAAVILTSLPKALPLKAGVMIILVMTGSAYFSYILPSLMQQVPTVLFGVIGLIIFASFALLASGKGQLPLTLLLICIATIPIMTLVSPQYAAALPKAYSRGIVMAVAAVWIVHAIWPRTLPAAAASPSAAGLPPARLALAGTAIVLPIMLVYLMYGITDALPVLITTIFLVANFDTKRGAAHGAAMMIGNFIGGIAALIAFHLLQIAPALATLALLLFAITAVFAIQMQKGGPQAPVMLLTLNQTLIILGLALANGSSNSGLWGTRLLQFGLACAFAVGMMTLILPRPSPTQK